MPSLTSDARFLGVDIRALWLEIRSAWSDANEWPLLSWLTPPALVRLLQADGAQSIWVNDIEPVRRAADSGIRFAAIELPEELVLRKTLALPAMAELDVSNAAALEARAVSPFQGQDLVWGYRASRKAAGGIQVDMALASRRQVAQYLLAQASRLDPRANPEVWVRRAAGSPIVIQGYGENARKVHAGRMRRWGYALLGSAVVLAGLIASTPTLQLRLQAQEAVAANADVMRRVSPVTREREQLMQSVEKLAALSEVVGGRVEPLRVLDQLTKALPDETALQSFKLQGQKLTLVGVTANAAALMQLLGEQPGVKDVRAPSAVTRLAGTSKENFVIEFMLDPKVYGVSSGAGPVLSQASTADVPDMSQVAPAVPLAAPTLPASTPTQAAAPQPKAPASAASPKSSFGGGRSSFGGARAASPAKPASSTAN